MQDRKSINSELVISIVCILVVGILMIAYVVVNSSLNMIQPIEIENIGEQDHMFNSEIANEEVFYLSNIITNKEHVACNYRRYTQSNSGISYEEMIVPMDINGLVTFNLASKYKTLGFELYVPKEALKVDPNRKEWKRATIEVYADGVCIYTLTGINSADEPRSILLDVSNVNILDITFTNVSRYSGGLSTPLMALGDIRLSNDDDLVNNSDYVVPNTNVYDVSNDNIPSFEEYIANSDLTAINEALGFNNTESEAVYSNDYAYTNLTDLNIISKNKVGINSIVKREMTDSCGNEYVYNLRGMDYFNADITYSLGGNYKELEFDVYIPSGVLNDSKYYIKSSRWSEAKVTFYLDDVAVLEINNLNEAYNIQDYKLDVTGANLLKIEFENTGYLVSGMDRPIVMIGDPILY